MIDQRIGSEDGHDHVTEAISDDPVHVHMKDEGLVQGHVIKVTDAVHMTDGDLVQGHLTIVGPVPSHMITVIEEEEPVPGHVTVNHVLDQGIMISIQSALVRGHMMAIGKSSSLILSLLRQR